jgi:hypothetical protein
MGYRRLGLDDYDRLLAAARQSGTKNISALVRTAGLHRRTVEKLLDFGFEDHSPIRTVLDEDKAAVAQRLAEQTLERRAVVSSALDGEAVRDQVRHMALAAAVQESESLASLRGNALRASEILGRLLAGLERRVERYLERMEAQPPESEGVLLDLGRAGRLLADLVAAQKQLVETQRTLVGAPERVVRVEHESNTREHSLEKLAERLRELRGTQVIDVEPAPTVYAEEGGN